jgi:hypothetical protein
MQHGGSSCPDTTWCDACLSRETATRHREELDADSLNELRRKVRQNRVSFPSQVPTFLKHDRPDLQRKAVQFIFCLDGAATG